MNTSRTTRFFALTALLFALGTSAAQAQQKTVCRHCAPIRTGSTEADILRSLPAPANHLALVIDEHFRGQLDTQVWQTRLLYNDPNDLLPRADFAVVQQAGNTARLIHKKAFMPGSSATPLWRAGALHTRTDPRGGALGPGRYEVTFQMPPVPGFQAAVWLFGWAGEIDLIEINGCNTSVWQSDAHNGGYGSGHVHHGVKHSSPSWSDTPQTIGLTWSNDSLEWFLNGNSVRVVHKYYKREKRKWVGLTVAQAQALLENGGKVFGNKIFPNPHNRADLIINGYVKYGKSEPCTVFSGMPNTAADSFALDVHAVRVWQPTEFELVGPDSVRLDQTAEFVIKGYKKTQLLNTQFAPGIQLVRHEPVKTLFILSRRNEVITEPIRIDLKGVAAGHWELDIWIEPEGLSSLPTRLRKTVVVYE
jgi:hypothetical protein